MLVSHIVYASALMEEFYISTLKVYTYPPQTDLLFKFFLSFKYNVDFELQV